MGTWYTIGLALGSGVGVGVIASGLLAASRRALIAAPIVAAAAGALFALPFGWPFGWPYTLAAGVGGVVGASAALTVARGAIRRGATRLGLAAFLGVAGIGLLVLAAVPLLGYVMTVALTALAVRMRGRQAARYAGLRTLAK